MSGSMLLPSEKQKQSILTLTEKLMCLRTDPGNHDQLNLALAAVQDYLKGFTVEHFEVDGVRSLLFYSELIRPDRFGLILNGHLDVIPGKPEQYSARRDGDKLYGVGSMDMKSSVAVMAEVFKTMARKAPIPIALQIVTDEEVGGHRGTGYQACQMAVAADFVIAGEATGFKIANQARGVFQCRLTSKGVTAHGAYPWRGINAIERLMQALSQLQEAFPTPSSLPGASTWQTTLNIANVSTENESFDKIPDQATALVDIRFVPEDRARLVETVSAAMPEGVSFEIVTDEPALTTPSEHPVLLKLMESVRVCSEQAPICYGAMGTSDARFYQGVGVEFGPLGGGIGSDDEWVSVPSLYRFYEVLCHFIDSFRDSSSE